MASECRWFIVTNNEKEEEVDGYFLTKELAETELNTWPDKEDFKVVDATK